MLEMRHGLDKHGRDYSEESPSVRAEIELHSVRLLELAAIQSLQQGIAMHVSDFQREGVEQTEARAAINQAIQRVLWEGSAFRNIHPSLAKWTGVISNVVLVEELSGISNVEKS